ncbi:MAG TPA: hypothetical protein PL123_04785 [Bacteroidales bacterium]|nr:hypothetical protein [Bacteroidales bacterium]
MEKFRYIFLLLGLFTAIAAQSQSARIEPPKLEFDGKTLTIQYDFLDADPSDEYYVWVVIQKKNGDSLKLKSLSGDVGDVKAGKGKIITWLPSDDSIFLNEDISVEVQAERYVKAFNKGSSMLKSALFPGLGQTKVSNGKPYWLMGVVFYGSLAGGIVTYSGYKSNYDKYLAEETDPQKRSDFLSKAEKNATLSSALLVTAAVIWTSNIIWAGATPNKNQPLKYRPITLQPTADPLNGAALLTLRYKF